MRSDERAAADASATLEEAWRRFAIYDHNANRLQRGFLRLRIAAAVLGVVATVAAVLYSFVTEESVPELDDWRFYLRLVVLGAPVAVSVLVAMTARAGGGSAWVMVRGAAEALKREIYRYRTYVGPYRFGRQDRRHELQLAGRIESLSRRLAESEIVLEPYTADRLPPLNAVPEADDGFSDLSAERYIELRLRDQLGYFQRKSAQLVKQQRRLQWLVAGLGGAGTLLAAIGLEIWVPVAISLGGALGGYLELRNTDSMLANYTRNTVELENLITWWKTLTLEEKADPDVREELVMRTETVLQSENVKWQAQMQESLDKLEAKGKIHRKARRAALAELTVSEDEEVAVEK